MGDKFYHANGEIYQTNINAAFNIKQRLNRLNANGGISEKRNLLMTAPP